MVFSDLHFLYLFLPLALVLYRIVPPKLRNACLLAASMIFYAVGALDHPLYILLLVASVVITYFAARVLEIAEEAKKPLFILTLFYHFFLLFLFKYEAFFASSINSLLGRTPASFSLPVWELVLPIGISFYTFQAVSYLTDVYRGTVRAERSLIAFGTYLTMFPQLIAGPIVAYSDVAKELHRRRITSEDVVDGLRLFVLGLGAKVILANNLGLLWRDASETIGFDSLSAPMAWLAVIGFSLQLYFDFYGYSLMAQGMGRMLGFTIPDNFRHPYAATSMTEFWRRWHITLGTWFRQYVYIPLGGNRKGKLRTVLNLLVVWLMTGLWHGAGWNFLLWGLLLFVLLSIEKCGLLRFFEKYRVFGHLYMVLMIPLSWAIFAVTDIRELGTLLLRMFPFFDPAYAPAFPGDWLEAGKTYGLLLLGGIALSLPWARQLFDRFKKSVPVTLLLVGIFTYSVILLLRGLDNPFLYFRF